jgi:hypothetical protein
MKRWLIVHTISICTNTTCMERLKLYDIFRLPKNKPHPFHILLLSTNYHGLYDRFTSHQDQLESDCVWEKKDIPIPSAAGSPTARAPAQAPPHYHFTVTLAKKPTSAGRRGGPLVLQSKALMRSSFKTGTKEVRGVLAERARLLTC